MSDFINSFGIWITIVSGILGIWAFSESRKQKKSQHPATFFFAITLIIGLSFIWLHVPQAQSNNPPTPQNAITNTSQNTPQASLSTPSPTPTPVPTAKPTPLPYMVSKHGDVCQPPFSKFQASGWATANNSFAFTGNGSNVVISPCNISTPNYSVEATITIFDQDHKPGAGVVAHSDVGGQNGYAAGAGCRAITFGACGFFINPSFSSVMGIDQENENLIGATHTYKLVVNGTTLQLFYDNSVNPIDTQNLANYLQAGYAGFVCYGQCEVTTFKVIVS